MSPDLSLFLVAALAALHVAAGRLLPLSRVPRRHWLSLSGGVAIAYVFVEILPGLAAAEAAGGTPPVLAELGLYGLGLAGLTTFYGLELAALAARGRHRARGGGDHTTLPVFWVHIGTFAVYNALFSYLLMRMATPVEYALLFVAVALHYAGNDYHLREHHKEAYDRVGRWVLAGAVLAGWVAGALSGGATGARDDAAAIALVTAFLAGGVILNVVKGEVAVRGERSFVTFALGAASYAALLALV